VSWSWESGTLGFPALPSAMVKALGKENSKKTNCFAECLPTALGKENPKKRKQALPSARCRHSAKHFKKNKKHISLPSGDAWHSAKGPSP